MPNNIVHHHVPPGGPCIAKVRREGRRTLGRAGLNELVDETVILELPRRPADHLTDD